MVMLGSSMRQGAVAVARERSTMNSSGSAGATPTSHEQSAGIARRTAG